MTDECGIYQIARTMNNGTSHHHEDSNFTQPNTELFRTTITIRNISSEFPTRAIQQSTTTDQSTVTEEDRSAHGMIHCIGPVHTQFVTQYSRLTSFSSWPPGLTQHPQELADAGFFYTGRSDQVKCFYCDGGLESWEPTDSPWEEHIKWFSDCAFVQMRPPTLPQRGPLSPPPLPPRTLRPPALLPQERRSVITNTIQQHEQDASINSREPEIIKRRSIQDNLAEISILKTMAKTGKDQAQSIQQTAMIDQTRSWKIECLQKELKSLQKARSCKICMEDESSIVFVPCGHLCSCATCSMALQTCAVCRTPIQGMVRTFLV